MDSTVLKDNLNMLRCVACGFPELEQKEGALRCPNCGESFSLCEEEVPFLGKYTRDDCISLMEIMAVAKTVPNRKRPDFEGWERACKAYSVGSNQIDFQAIGTTRESFLWRFSEWQLWEILLDGLEMQGQHVLDVGAGEGFDSWRFVHRGAKVTALEYNATLAAQGKRNLPGLFWVSGFSHVLPFKDELFDFVVCNAALHHMLHIPEAMQEFLRVLKPNGIILTACDSFSADGISDNSLLSLFDEHEAVLLGVNENSPRLREFLATPEKYASALETEIFTTTLYEKDSLGIPAGYTQKWTLDALRRHCGQSISGSLAMRIRKKHSIKILAPLLENGWLSANELFELQKNIEGGLSAIVSHLPHGDYLNMPIPHPWHNKFLQQNGWRFPKSGVDWQEGWGRVNSFWTRQVNDRYLILDINMPVVDSTQLGYCQFLINGKEVTGTELVRGVWYAVSVPVFHVPPDTAFVLTIQTANAQNFALRRIRIGNPYFADSAIESPIWKGYDEHPGILACISKLLSSDEKIFVIWLPGDNNRQYVLHHLPSHQIEYYCPQSMKEQYRIDLPDKNIHFYRADMEGLMECITGLKGMSGIALLPADTFLESSVSTLFYDADIPLLSCVSNSVVAIALENNSNDMARENFSWKQISKRILPNFLFSFVKNIGIMLEDKK